MRRLFNKRRVFKHYFPNDFGRIFCKGNTTANKDCRVDETRKKQLRSQNTSRCFEWHRLERSGWNGHIVDFSCPLQDLQRAFAEPIIFHLPFTRNWILKWFHLQIKHFFDLRERIFLGLELQCVEFWQSNGTCPSLPPTLPEWGLNLPLPNWIESVDKSSKRV